MSLGLLEHMPSPITASLDDFRWVTDSVIFQEDKIIPISLESTGDRRIQSSISLSGSWFIQLENCRDKETGWN